MADRIPAPGSYRELKRQTARALNWMHDSSNACNYQSKRSRQSEGQIRMGIEEIADRVRCIIKCHRPFLLIPLAVLQDGRQAIELRRRHSDFHSELECARYDITTGFQGSVSTSTQQHRHFTNRLERFLDALEKRDLSALVDRESQPQGGHRTNVDSTTRNLYGDLEVEITHDANDFSLYFPIGLSDAASSSQTKQELKESRARSQKVEDMIMRASSFFHDLNDLQKAACGIWAAYCQDEVDICAASMAVNCAIATAGQMEDDFIASVPELQDMKPPNGVGYTECGMYDAIIGLCSKLSGGTPSLEADYAFPEEGQFWFADTAFLLKKIRLAIMQIPNYPRTDIFSAMDRIPEDLRMKHFRTSVWQPWPRVLTSEAFVWVFCKSPRTVLSCKGFSELQEKDARRTGIILDALFRREVQHGSPIFRDARLKAGDEALGSLENLMTGNLTIKTVFACSLLFRIIELTQDAEEDGPWPREELMFGISKACDALGIPSEFSPSSWLGKRDSVNKENTKSHVDVLVKNKALITGSDSFWNSIYSIAKQLKADQTLALTRSEREFFRRLVASVERSQSGQKECLRKLAMISSPIMRPNLDPDMFWRQNALACGTALYSLTMAAHQAGVSLANAHLEVLWSAYLYVAVRQGVALKGVWAEMDRLIQLHSQGMFLGGIPSSAANLVNCFEIRTGLKLSQGKKKDEASFGIYQGNGSDYIAESARKPKEARGSCLSISDTAWNLSRWFDGKETLIRAVHAAQRSRSKAKEDSEAIVPDSTHWDPGRFLGALCDHITKEDQGIQIDFVGLVVSSIKLLDAIYAAEVVGSDLIEAHLTSNLERGPDGKKMRNAAARYLMVQSILAHGKVEQGGPARFKGQKTTGVAKDSNSHVAAAGKVCQKFLAESGLLVDEKYPLPPMVFPNREPKERKWQGWNADHVFLDELPNLPLLEQGGKEAKLDQQIRREAKKGVFAWIGHDGKLQRRVWLDGYPVIFNTRTREALSVSWCARPATSEESADGDDDHADDLRKPTT